MYLKWILIILLLIIICKKNKKEGYYECVDKYGDNLNNVKSVYIPQLVGYTKNDYLYKTVPILASDDPFSVNADFFKY